MAKFNNTKKKKLISSFFYVNKIFITAYSINKTGDYNAKNSKKYFKRFL